MSFFTESPFAIGITGVSLVAISLFLLLQTTRASFLYAAIGLAVLTTALLVNERRLITPREEVSLTLHSIARDLESDSIDAVLAHVSSNSPKIQQKAKAALTRVIIDQVKIKPNLTVTLDSGTTATATFNAVVIGSDRKQVVRNQRGAFFFIVDLAMENGEWRIVDYQRHDPRSSAASL